MFQEKLSEGEIPIESCRCEVGEVCDICVPRLDLSFSELKTKPKQKRRGHSVKSSSESDFSGKLKSDLSLSSLPLGLEPKPPSSKEFCSVSALNSLSLGKEPCTKDHRKGNQLGTNSAASSNKQTKITSHNFSEIANLVLNDLRVESLKPSTFEIPKPYPPSASRSSSSAKKHSRSNRADAYSSSDSAVSSKSARRAKSRPTPKTKLNQKTPLVIKSPEEIPKIDVVIEGLEDIAPDDEVSLSSYQTSVTSVSVENLALGLTSQSQSSSETHLPSAS